MSMDTNAEQSRILELVAALEAWAEAPSLQAQIHEWSARNFPEQTPMESFVGVTEEVGELAHCVLKSAQGLPGAGNAEDAVGDIVIFLSEFCSRSGLDMDRCIRETWAKVQKRKREDWSARDADPAAHLDAPATIRELARLVRGEEPV